jgi:hypothetical protein
MTKRVQGVLVAQMAHTPEEESEFRAWYSLHAREALDLPGVLGVRRYRLADVQAPGVPGPSGEWFAIYDIDGDPQQIIDEIRRRRADGKWQPRKGVNEASMRMWFYDALDLDGDPLSPPACDDSN